MLDKKEKKKKVKVYRSHLHGPCFADHKRNVLLFFFWQGKSVVIVTLSFFFFVT